VRSHLFVDGNKRTARLAVGAFYALNGYWLIADPEYMVGFMVDAAEGVLDVDAIAALLKGWAYSVDPSGRIPPGGSTRGKGSERAAPT
jgi:prophage maintenance system killer protein